MKLKNREVQNPNRYVLKVKNILGDFIGEIYELEVEIDRKEGEVYEEGTKLDAKTLSILHYGYYLDKDYLLVLEDPGVTNEHVFHLYYDKNLSVNIETEEDAPFTLNKVEVDDKHLELRLAKNEESLFDWVTDSTYQFTITLINQENTQLNQTISVEVEYLTSSVSVDD